MIDQKNDGPVVTMILHRAKKGHEAELGELVKRHWPTILRLGLVRATPAQIWRASDREGNVAELLGA